MLCQNDDKYEDIAIKVFEGEYGAVNHDYNEVLKKAEKGFKEKYLTIYMVNENDPIVKLKSDLDLFNINRFYLNK